VVTAIAAARDDNLCGRILRNDDATGKTDGECCDEKEKGFHIRVSFCEVKAFTIDIGFCRVNYIQGKLQLLLPQKWNA
jgi:hypothetical protein